MLEDLLIPGLKVVFGGTAVGHASARQGRYYAGGGNKFWDILFEAGFTTCRLSPEEYRLLPEFGIGLTDLLKGQEGMDRELDTSTFQRTEFVKKIRAISPLALCFNGKRAAELFYGRKEVRYGRQEGKLGPTTVFVLPSTSAAASRWWDPKYWCEVKEYLVQQETVPKKKMD